MESMLESIMLICFGLSWPISVMKNIKAGTAKNMSLRFTMLIIAGYIAGIAAKLWNHSINYVLAVYILNLAMVSVNLFVYFINKRKDKALGIVKSSSVKKFEDFHVDFCDMMNHGSGSVSASNAVDAEYKKQFPVNFADAMRR